LFGLEPRRLEQADAPRQIAAHEFDKSRRVKIAGHDARGERGLPEVFGNRRSDAAGDRRRQAPGTPHAIP